MTAAKKNTDEVERLGGLTEEWFLNLWVNRLIPYVPEWVHPNHITACSFVSGVGATGSAILRYNSTTNFDIGLSYLFGAFVAFACYTMDCLDGQIARKRNLCSPFGGFLDHWCDSFSIPNLFYACHLFLSPNAHFFFKWTICTVGSNCFNIQLLHAHFCGKAEQLPDASLFMFTISVLFTIGMIFLTEIEVLLTPTLWALDNVFPYVVLPACLPLLKVFYKTSNKVRMLYFFNLSIFLIHYSWAYFGALGIQECLRTGIFVQWHMNSCAVKTYEFRRTYRLPWLLLAWVLALPLLRHIHEHLIILFPVHVIILEATRMYNVRHKEFKTTVTENKSQKRA